jgi:hypothetical protein
MGDPLRFWMTRDLLKSRWPRPRFEFPFLSSLLPVNSFIPSLCESNWFCIDVNAVENFQLLFTLSSHLSGARPIWLLPLPLRLRRRRRRRTSERLPLPVSLQQIDQLSEEHRVLAVAVVHAKSVVMSLKMARLVPIVVWTRWNALSRKVAEESRSR